MTCSLLRTATLRRLAILLAVATTPVLLSAAERREESKQKAGARTVEMFAAMESGELDVKFIAKSDKEARVIMKNLTGKPLDVQLPDVFAGVPVLAQFGMGGGGGGFGGGGGGGGGQGLGGGGGGGGGFGGGGQGGGGGGGFFNLQPERVANFRVACVCLDHGKPNPRAAIPYKIVKLESYDSSPELAALMRLFGSGRLHQRSVQAATWHLRNGMSWQELAAKEIRRANGARYPYFSRKELALAFKYTREAKEMAKDQPVVSPGEASQVSAE